jgi:hypothetical protein
MAPDADEPVRLSEDADTGDRFLIYGTDLGVKVELRYAGETLWATQYQMAEMFGVDRTSITKHLKKIYEEGELDPAATCEEISQVRQEGTRTVTRARPIYNLNAVISVGYRVSSKQLGQSLAGRAACQRAVPRLRRETTCRATHGSGLANGGPIEEGARVAQVSAQEAPQ